MSGLAWFAMSWTRFAPTWCATRWPPWISAGRRLKKSGPGAMAIWFTRGSNRCSGTRLKSWLMPVETPPACEIRGSRWQRPALGHWSAAISPSPAPPVDLAAGKYFIYTFDAQAGYPYGRSRHENIRDDWAE